MSDSLFIDEYRAIMEKQGVKEATNDILYPTGFLNFDFLNGYVANGKTPDGQNYSYYNVGMTDGSVNMVISRSGGGKSTLVCQMASNIASLFPESYIIEDNVEGGMNMERRIHLSGYDKETYHNKYIVHNEAITVETYFENIKKHCDEKIKNESKWLYDTGHFDIYGKPIIKYKPTIVILDSLAMISTTKVFEDKELAGNMSGAAGAKGIAGMLRVLVPYCKKANVIMFMINHINSDVQINPYQAKQSSCIYLKPGETLPKGNMPMYASTNLIRIDDKKLKENEAFGIKGTLNTLTLLKSRTAPPNTTTTLVFDPKSGFDKTLSLYMMLKEDGYINGAGIGCYFGDHTDCKFSQKTFKEKFLESPELRQYFQDACYADLTSKINRFKFKKKEETETISGLMNKLLSARITE